ncbi:MAG TPA: hypothetical protein PLX89_26320 [Verrucomicrobiota bacterium]|nr:hypothetical protein [Verrucomicrobiota bacterium]
MIRRALLVLVFVLAWNVRAQVDLDLILDRQFFLPAEDIEVGVRIANFTGEPLTLGEDEGWLQFSVQEVKGRIAGKLAEPQESGAFTLEPATRGTLRFNLTPLFAMDDPGVYQVSATIRLPTGEQVGSAPQTLDIVSGVKLNEPREVGVKLPDGTVERRKYILQRVSFTKRVQLYLRVTDASEGKTYKVMALGPMVSFDRPEWLVDRASRFHVFHRADSNNYLYHVFAGDGTLTLRQTWLAGDSGLPELRVNDEGEVRVFGAVRRVSSGDVPRPPENSAGTGIDTNAPVVAVRPTTNTNDVQAPKQP